MPPASVPIAPVGPVAAATMVFRENGLLNVAAIVKATFAFEHHGPMRIAPPEPVLAREVHRMNNPTRSVTATSDLVPRLPGADVLLLGQAHAPGGSAESVVVRLAVGRGDTALLEKSILVVGDRRGTQIKPFRSIPLVYEKTFGGPGYRENPLGTGALSGDPPPNLLDPRAPADGRTATTFAPISRSWPVRAAMVSAEVRAALEKPIAEIPPGFDYRYFHAAPPDQRLSHLVGDEWIVLENLHAQHPSLHLLLPGAQAMVRVMGPPGGTPRVFSLRADTLRIDTDSERCTLVWRNSFRVEEADLGRLQLFGAVALPGAPIEWPDDIPMQSARPVPVPALRAASSGTVIIEDERASSSLNSTMEVADEDIESVQLDGDEPDLASTAILASTAVPATAPLPPLLHGQPAPAPAPVPAPRPAARRADPRAGMTLDLGAETEAVNRAVMPFASGGAAQPADPRAATPIPGSPWDPGRAHALPSEDAPTFELGSTDLASTLVPTAVRVTAPLPAAPVPAAPPPPAPVPTGPLPPPMVPPPGQALSAEPPLPAAPPPPVDATGQGPSLGAAEQAPPPVQAAPEPPAQPVIQAPSPAPPPVQPPAAPPPAAPQKASPSGDEDPWGRALRDGRAPRPEEAAPPPPKPAPAAPPPQATGGLKDALYRRFKKG